ncbi:MAG: DNA recombination protein RmuC, partial [Sphingomonas sp.]
MEPVAVLFIFVALVLGLAAGWWFASRTAATLRTERDARATEFKKAIVDLAGAEERARAADALRQELAVIRDDRDAARADIARLEAEARGFDARLTELREAKDALAAQFGQVGQKLLAEAQDRFLQR